MEICSLPVFNRKQKTIQAEPEQLAPAKYSWASLAHNGKL